MAQNPKSRFGSAPNPKSRGVSETQIQPWGRAPNLKSSLEGAPNPGLGGLKIPNPGESLNLKSCLGWGSNPKSRQGAGGLQILKAPWEEEEENKGMKNPSQPPNADSIPARGTCAASIPAKIAEKHQFQRNASSREKPIPGGLVVQDLQLSSGEEAKPKAAPPAPHSQILGSKPRLGWVEPPRMENSRLQQAKDGISNRPRGIWGLVSSSLWKKLGKAPG